MTEQSKAEQELVEKIADTYRSFSFWQDKHLRSISEFEDKFIECATQVVALILDHFIEQGGKTPDMLEQEGYVQLDDVQSLPPQNNKCNLWDLYQKGWLESQQSMRMAGWRKVKEVIKDAKTASIKDAQHQQEKEEFVRQVEDCIPKTLTNYVGFWKQWQALKAEFLGEVAE